MDLIKTIERGAKHRNACAKGRRELLTIAPDNTGALVDLYFKNIDFCLENDFPDNGFIADHFRGKMEAKGVFLDQEIELTNIPKVVCLGATTGRIEVNQYSCAVIYVKHDSAINIIAKDNAFVRVDAFDNSVVHIHTQDRAKVCVNVYGDKTSVKHSDDSAVEIREQHSKSKQ